MTDGFGSVAWDRVVEKIRKETLTRKQKILNGLRTVLQRQKLEEWKALQLSRLHLPKI